MELIIDLHGAWRAGRSITSFVSSLSNSPSARTALEKALTSFADQPAGELALGCMGINAVCEFGRSDDEVSQLIDASNRAFSTALRRVLAGGMHNGEFPASLDVGNAVAFLVSTLAGMKVSAKTGASSRALSDIAGFAVRALG